MVTGHPARSPVSLHVFWHCCAEQCLHEWTQPNDPQCREARVSACAHMHRTSLSCYRMGAATNNHTREATVQRWRHCLTQFCATAQNANGKKPHLFCPAHRMPHRESEVRCIDPRHKLWRARSQFDGFSERNPGGSPHDVHECRHPVLHFAQQARSWQLKHIRK